MSCSCGAYAPQNTRQLVRAPAAIPPKFVCGRRRYVVLGTALLSLVGACVIIFSALRFRELSKRFVAIRLIFFLALTDAAAAAFNILGAFVDVHEVLRPKGGIPFLCALQAVGLLYFNLASIMWTSYFAFVRAHTLPTPTVLPPA